MKKLSCMCKYIYADVVDGQAYFSLVDVLKYLYGYHRSSSEVKQVIDGGELRKLHIGRDKRGDVLFCSARGIKKYIAAKNLQEDRFIRWLDKTERELLS